MHRNFREARYQTLDALEEDFEWLVREELQSLVAGGAARFLNRNRDFLGAWTRESADVDRWAKLESRIRILREQLGESAQDGPVAVADAFYSERHRGRVRALAGRLLKRLESGGGESAGGLAWASARLYA